MTRVAPILLLGLLAACSGGPGGTVDDGRAGQRLEQQRLDVRAGARDLLAALEDRLGGTTTSSSGQFRGCEGAFNDQYRSFQYLAQARVDTPDAVDAGALASLAEDAGFTGSEQSSAPGGRRSVQGRQGDVRAVLSVYDQRAYVLVDVSGPCVEVPEDERDAWLDRDEPSPHLR